ncbi:MAG: type IIA DNA topoisomerase subunit B [Bacteroidales bacterium]|nr:type IIA DNA topoisomerase subunit B [Bacteroidales bacterium]
MSDNYNDSNIITLEWYEHIRLRPGMYIGKLGDGSSHDDGIYVLLKEVIDNSIDEFMQGHGKSIDVTIKDNLVTVRDYGRGIPLNKMVDCVSKINTGGKFNSEAFTNSIGQNGVGVKAVNALSTYFKVQSFRDGQTKEAEFSCGKLTSESPIGLSDERSGTYTAFNIDDTIFANYHWYTQYIEKMMWNYAYLNKGLSINFNGRKFLSKNGLLDLLCNNVNQEEMLYPPIHLQDEKFEFVLTHTKRHYGEEYHSFVNSQNTTQGGTHQNAFREALVKTFRSYFGKEFDANDIRNAVVAAISIKVQEPVFESQTKIRLGSTLMQPDGQTIRNYVNDVVGRLLDNYLHMNTEVGEIIRKKILESESERKAIANIKKGTKEIQKKASLNNSKLRDCKYHFNTDHNNEGENTTIFITEGMSASGSITSARDSRTQAVFSMRGKTLNTMKKADVYKNEELNLLNAALNLESGLEGLRYNNIVIATDADVDGMHIRLLLLTYFLNFFPDVVRSGHVYILQTPLFRVRNKQKTHYCYSEQEKVDAIKKLGGKPEITRFKGLGEIDAKEFEHFIGPTMRLEPVVLESNTRINELLEYYMGNNTPERQQFIIENLREEIDEVNPEEWS